MSAVKIKPLPSWNRDRDIFEHLDELYSEIEDWRSTAIYDPDMSGLSKFKAFNRSALDRCRKQYIEDNT